MAWEFIPGQMVIIYETKTLTAISSRMANAIASGMNDQYNDNSSLMFFVLYFVP